MQDGLPRVLAELNVAAGLQQNSKFLMNMEQDSRFVHVCSDYKGTGRSVMFALSGVDV